MTTPPTLRRTSTHRRRADQTTMRRINLSLVLRHLREDGPASRARIATATGLNKATVSSLVAELVRRGLVTDGGIDRKGAVGRPGRVVELAGRGICGVGVEVNVDYVCVLALDLRDDVLYERRRALDVGSLPVEAVLDEVAGLVTDAFAELARCGAVPAGVTVAVPGTVDIEAGNVRVSANLRWRDVGIADAVLERLGRTDVPVGAGNDANLSALAEHAMGVAAGTAELACLVGSAGVGCGVISGGRLLRGSTGFAGEIGHTPLDVQGRPCGCGRRGCWETAVGLRGLLRLATGPGDPLRDPALDLAGRLTTLRERAESGDRRTLDALAQLGTAVGVGAGIVVNLVNPQVLVLGGYFAAFTPYLHDALMAELRARAVAPDAAGCRVVASTLGFTAAARGGAHAALDRVLHDPSLASRTRPREVDA
ncbi:MAG TPA: ROK family protein [Streptosporangiales bacterium]